MKLYKILLCYFSACMASFPAYGGDNNIEESNTILKAHKEIINGLPNEVIYSIASYLPPKDIMNFLSVNKRLHSLHSFDFLKKIIGFQSVKWDKKSENDFFNQELLTIVNTITINKDHNILLLMPEQRKEIEDGNDQLLLKLYQYHYESIHYGIKSIFDKVKDYKNIPLNIHLKATICAEEKINTSEFETDEDYQYITKDTKHYEFLNEIIGAFAEDLWDGFGDYGEFINIMNPPPSPQWIVECFLTRVVNFSNVKAYHDTGIIYATYALGDYYRGIDRLPHDDEEDEPVDEIKALGYYKLAAEKGYKNAHVKIQEIENNYNELSLQKVENFMNDEKKRLIGIEIETKKRDREEEIDDHNMAKRQKLD